MEKLGMSQMGPRHHLDQKEKMWGHERHPHDPSHGDFQALRFLPGFINPI